jgi:hypothetical protein
MFLKKKLASGLDQRHSLSAQQLDIPGRRIKTMTQQPGLGIRKQVWLWLKSQVVGQVSDEDSLCEFDCRKQECSQGEWADCERRLNKAAGELRPGKK